MRQFFNLRILAGVLLTVAAAILLIFSHILPGQKKLDSRFTEKVDRIHHKTLTQLKSTERYDQLSLSYPVFVYNQYDSLIYWSEEIFPGPDSLIGRTDSVFTFSYKGINGMIFKDTHRQIKYFTFIPVSGHNLAQQVLPTCLKYYNKSDNVFLTYKGLFKFKLVGHDTDTPFSPFSWLIVLLVLVAVILFSKGVNKPKETLHPGTGKVFPYIIFTLAILLLDLFNLLPADWFIATDLIKGLVLLSPFTVILLLVMGMIMTTVPDNLKINILSGKTYARAIVPLIFLLIGVIAVLSVNLSRFFYLKANQNFNLDRLFSVGIQELILLFILLILFTLCILIIQQLYKLIHRISKTRYIKLAGAVIALIMLFVFKLGGWIHVPFVPFLLGFVILIILMDLYFDRKGFSSNWVLTWMIMISSLLSFIIFHADLQKDQKENQKELTKSLYDRDTELEKQLINSHLSKTKNYNQDEVIIEGQQLLKTMEGMAKITDSLYFDPLSGSYFLQIPINAGDDIQPLFVFQRTDFDIQQENKSMDRLSIIYKSWTDKSDKVYPLKDSTWNEKGVSYVSHSNPSGYTVISARKIPGLLRPVSMFAALFFIISISLFLISLLDSRMNMLPSGLNIRFFNQKSLRSRIQMSILALTILAFIVVGFVSANYFKKIYAVQQEELSKAHAKAIRLELQSDTDEIYKKSKSKNTQPEAIISPVLTLMSGHLLFIKNNNENGSLLNTFPVTTPNLRIPHHFTTRLSGNTSPLVPLTVQHTDNGVYIPLDINGSIKYFFDPIRSDDEMQGKISDLLATFLSIYAVLFMLSVFIAIGLANSITHPIEMLGQKLKGLKLSRKNETVDWQNEDEIGTLIGIYNEMINKLGDNAKLMAKIERDSAWKEMAQQVAHEIKNPLTPLKLNIQYLESKVGTNPEIAPQLIAQLAPSLIEQIDNLSQIASEFSNFAQLPDARNEKLNLNDLVKKVHDFFRKREDMNLKLTLPINDVIVFADKNHMVRILNNVIKNAIQAIPEDRPGKIAITLYRLESNAVIKVSDNGTGIPDNMREKVFSPNFTTKSSGTGLGLAIAINMLESFGGRIYFETEENVGSDFFIEVPLMRLEDNFPQANTVFLED